MLGSGPARQRVAMQRARRHPLLASGALMLCSALLWPGTAQASVCDAAKGESPRGTALAAAPSAGAQSARTPSTTARSTAEGDLLLSDGRRLAPGGIALPTRLHPDPALLTAARRAADAVLAGRMLQAAQGPLDRHGRLAGDAVLGAQADLPADDLTLALLRAGAGYARPQGACAAAQLAAEDEARRDRRGLWAVAEATLASDDLAGLRRKAGLFTLVEGRVRAVGTTRDRTYVNFGRSWREDFTVIIARGDFATIFGHGLLPATLRGTLVRVRGVIGEDGGPAIFPRAAGDLVRIAERNER